MSEILLLINPAKTYVFPFSSRGLAYVTAPVQKFLTHSESDIFLNKNGELLKISDATLSNPGLLSTLKLMFKLPVSGDVKLSPLDMAFPDFQLTLIDTLRRSRGESADDDETWWLLADPIDEVCEKIASTQGFQALYAIMDFPADEDCLDLL